MVFDGQSEQPYRSTDMPAPTNLYGQTKLMAEREVLEHNQKIQLSSASLFSWATVLAANVAYTRN